jgi:hypothetical protein
MKKVLFICKKNDGYGMGKHSGLFNSTRFVAEALVANAIKAEVVEVNDNNDIDREVTKSKPNIVVIEALWVVPEKFKQLKKIHPKVRWFVHLHSNIPFLALEGIAVDWCKKYEKLGIGVIVNSDRAKEGLEVFLKSPILLHNVYIGHQHKPKAKKKDGLINVGCFGAVRPMKNQLSQALAAIKFAQENKLHLRFHINATRSEGGDPVLKNLRELFRDLIFAELIEVPWLAHVDFLKYLKGIDIGLQVSLSETFNIVAADCVSVGLPVVTSDEISWVNSSCYARTDSVDDIAKHMDVVYGSAYLVKMNQWNLRRFSGKSAKEWVNFVKSVKVSHE